MASSAEIAWISFDALLAPTAVSAVGATTSPEGKKTSSTVLGNAMRIFLRRGALAATGSMLAASTVSVWSSATSCNSCLRRHLGERQSPGRLSVGDRLVRWRRRLASREEPQRCLLMMHRLHRQHVPVRLRPRLWGDLSLSPDMGAAIPTDPTPCHVIWSSAGSARIRCTPGSWVSILMGAGSDPRVRLSEPFCLLL